MPAYSVLLRVEIARFTRSGTSSRFGWLPCPDLRPGSRGKPPEPAGLRRRTTEHPGRESRIDSSLLL